MAGSAAVRAMNGQPLLPTRDEMIQDLVMAAPGGLHAWDEARIAVAKKMVAGTHPDVQAYDAVAGSSDPKITGTQRAYAADQAEEMRGRAAGLLKAAGIEPRLVAAFGESFPTDKYGMPIPPTVLPSDSSLLQKTYDWKTLKAIAEIPGDHPLVEKGLLRAGTVSREELHNAIIEDRMRQAVPIPLGRKPVAYTTGGGAGSGKTTVLGGMNDSGEVDTSNAVQIKPDEFKGLIPEFVAIHKMGDSRASDVVQNESVYIAQKLLERATSPHSSARYDIVHDTQLANPVRAEKTFRDLKQKGYDTHLIAVTIDPDEAMIRAFLRAKKEGRWTPSKDIAQVHPKFNAALKSYLRMYDRADVWDNTIPNRPLKIATKKSNSPVDILQLHEYNQIDERGK